MEISCLKQVNAAALCILTSLDHAERKVVSQLVGTARQSENICQDVLSNIKTRIETNKVHCTVDNNLL